MAGKLSIAIGHSSVCSRDRGYSRQYIHHFVTKPEYHPSLCKYYDLPSKVKAEARIIMKNWLADRTIQHSNSPHRNPLVAVKKNRWNIYVHVETIEC